MTVNRDLQDLTCERAKTEFVNGSNLARMAKARSFSTWISQDIDVSAMTSELKRLASAGVQQFQLLRTNVDEKVRQLCSEFEVVEWLSMEGLLYATLLVVIVSTILVISLNVYRKIRYAIPARVNCWFCNTNTKVLYSLKDTWTCPNCHQYNGFTADGHYNKRIPAQFIEALNRPVRGAPAKGYQFDKSASNGLCSQCNLNQVLKVFQLSSFVPVNERNYDAEIEAEQKRLEQLYDICGQCKAFVEKSVMRMPNFDKEQSVTGKVNAKVNKVTPIPTQLSQVDIRSSSKFNGNDDGELSLLHNDCLRDVSDTSDSAGSGNSFLSLDNLEIGSKHRKKTLGGTQRPFPSGSASPRSFSPTPSNFCPSSLPYNRQSPMYASGPSLQLNQDATPLWKDYPLVQGGLSPTYSLVDSMSCPVGRPAYVNYNAAASPSQFSYQSSNLGGVFGGRKPLISPPKFSNNSSPLYSPFIRYGPYYDITASSTPLTVGHAPVMFSPQCFANPISRSSSQSSGFVSQHGGPQTPQSQVQSPTNGYRNGT